MAVLALIGWMLHVAFVAAQFNNPPGVEIWCGKAYKSTNDSFEPGGAFQWPQRSATPLLDLRIYSRMNIYLGNEANGTFVIDAGMSDYIGQPLCDSPSLQAGYVQAAAETTIYRIRRSDTGAVLAEAVEVGYNSTGTQVAVALDSFEPRFEPYEIVLQSLAPKCGQTYQAFEARTQLVVLPPRTDGGSVTKVDRLYGGLMVQSAKDDKVWEPIFPYSFYLDFGKFLEGDMERNVKSFADLGYNIVHPTPGAGPEPFEPAKFARFLEVMEQQTSLRLMYDMRWTFKDMARVEEQVNRLKTRKSVLLWYTADEPDGNSDPLNSTRAAYDLITKLDPYHPTSLVLNCQNFYYKEYTSGADIVLTDPYPVAVNTSFSNQWHTVCNATYGDCGCDNCHGSLRDVSDRMHTLHSYERMLRTERAPQKPLWGVPQAFGGSEYWMRAPSADEEAVMAALFVGAGAKGLVAWNFPTTEALTRTTSRLAKVLTARETVGLLLGAQPELLGEIKGAGTAVDAAAWRADGKMLVSVVHTGNAAIDNVVSIELPMRARNAKLLWPPERENTWIVDGRMLSKPGIKSLEVSLLVFDTY